MKTSVIAVLDVGKTNKKVSLYSRAFEVVATERTTLETVDYEGLEAERPLELIEWFEGVLKSFSADYAVEAISITTHGATCAVLDAQGDLVHPVISYTSAKGAEVQEAFHSEFGSPEELHRPTGTPDLGFVNLAKALYYLKTRKPEAWKRAKHVLFYPQYLGYLLTGALGLEPTYLGNHSYLWNLQENDWSTVARGLGVDSMFPSKLSAPWDRLGAVKPEIRAACGLPESCQVTMGIHDSNANFLPYLAQGHSHFVLNSTGTWCVLMSTAPNALLTDEELRHKVFFNLDAFNRPVKTCIFPAGMEYEAYMGLTECPDRGDDASLAEVIRKRALFVFPGVLPEASAFPGTRARVECGAQRFDLVDLRAQGGKPMSSSGPEYVAALNLSLALQTAELLRNVGKGPGTDVFIEGGFSRNVQYCSLLAALCPDCRVALTNLREGTSMGAALLGWMLAQGNSLEAMKSEFEIEIAPIQPAQAEGIAEYAREFMRRVQ